jgi:hypothetical protein
MSKKEGAAAPSDGAEEDSVGEPSGEKRQRLDSGSATTPPSYIPATATGETTQHQHTNIAASPPRFLNLDDIMKMATGVTDMTLAHELAVNDDFRLERAEPPPDSLEGRVRNIVHKAFWDSLEHNLQTNPEDHSLALRLLQDVKESLLELLLPQHGRLREKIEEVLDLTLIQQRAEHGGVDFRLYADFVIGVMAMLCAPVRDEQISALKQITDILPLYKEICDLLSVMKKDMVNFAITQLRPMIKQHSAEYERNKFQALLVTQQENGVDGLAFTKDWLSRHLTKRLAELKSSTTEASKQTDPNQQSALHAASQTHPDASVPAATVTVDDTEVTAAGAAASGETATGTTPTGETATGTTAAVPSLWSHPASAAPASTQAITHAVINAAYVELIDWDESRAYPETMLVDMKRLTELQERATKLTLVAGVLAVTFSTVGMMVQGLADFKLTLKRQTIIILGEAPLAKGDMLKDMMTSVAEQVIKVVSECLTERGFKPLSSVHTGVLKCQIVALVEPSNPIRLLMKSRLTGFIASVLSAPPRTKDVPIPAGFTALQDELTRACESFVRVISYNYTTFGTYYRDIVATLIAAECKTAT